MRHLVLTVVYSIALVSHGLDRYAQDKLPAIKGPVVNGINLTLPSWPNQPLARLGLLDVTQEPFSADPSGSKDSTAAIQAAVLEGRRRYLTVFLPAGEYKITSTVLVSQPERKFYTTDSNAAGCNNPNETYGKAAKLVTHCGRVSPVVLQGSVAELGKRAVLVVDENTGFKGPVVKITNPENENVNMNQVFASIDIRIAKGNPDAVGIYARGAQGVSVQDVSIFAGDASIGLQGGAGSGGSHINVTVIGGRVGIDVSQAQPSPTLTGVTLINQSLHGLFYSKPGRQTLSVTGMRSIQSLPGASAVFFSQPISIVDAIIDVGPQTTGINCTSGARNIFLRNVWVRGATAKGTSAVQLPNGTSIPGRPKGEWLVVRTLAAPGDGVVEPFGASTPVFVDGVKLSDAIVDTSSSPGPPANNIQSQHLWAREFPTWESQGACFATDFGAKGDLVSDDTKALQAMLGNASCQICVLSKGYYAVSSTITVPTGKALVGVARIYSNIVPHLSVTPIDATKPAWPLLETRGANVTVAALSVLSWKHMNTTFALRWGAESGVWRRAHINRVDVDPGRFATALYNRPFSVMDGSGGGRFYNFYQENWNRQGPKYRHLLVNGTSSPWSCYHCNTEHSQGEANLEIRGAKASISIFGFKGEGNYVQIWVTDSAEFFLSGYGGNASPFPTECPYPPGYTQDIPSLLRIERTDKVMLVSLYQQACSKNCETRCGIFDTGFAGSMYDPKTTSAIVEAPSGSGEKVTTEPLVWPVLYSRGHIFSPR